MLPAAHRLRRSGDFASTLRRGRRVGSPVIALHVSTGAPDEGSVTRFGLVVSKAVGNSVVRHRVSRRLRAVLADRMDLFPAGSDVVVRAMPAAASSSSAELASAVDDGLRRLRRPARTMHR